MLLDTNIILDYLSATRPEHRSAADLLEALFETTNYLPVVAASSLKDAYYILCRKYHNESIVRERLHGFLDVVDMEELTHEVVEAAFASDEPDFEDGIIRATAELCGAVAIVTRDAGAFAKSSVPAMTARQFCERLDEIGPFEPAGA